MKKLPHVFIVLFALLSTIIILGTDFSLNIPVIEGSSRWALLVNDSVIPLLAVFLAAFLAEYVNRKAKMGVENTFFMVLISGMLFVLLSSFLSFISFLPLVFATAVLMMAGFSYFYIFLATYCAGKR